MAKPKKNAPSKKIAKNKNSGIKKVRDKKSPSKKIPPKSKPSAKKNGAKPSGKKKNSAKAPVKKDLVRKKSDKKSKTSPKPKARPTALPKRAKAPVKETKLVKKPVSKPEPKEPKKSATKSVPVEKRAPKSEAAEPKPASPNGVPTGKPGAKSDNKRVQLRKKIIGGKTLRPIAFTLDEAREIAKNAAKVDGADTSAVAKTPSAPAKPDLNKLAKAIAPSHVRAASLADILGFNPKKAQKAALFADPETIPEKYRRYYKLLLALRDSLTEGLSLHTEETLRRSTKEDAGDLSSYGQHMADAGTDTFDRDFALSMVANEQEALSEIDAAIKRIENGTYGICEVTQKPIAKERLLAVPFTRYSAEAQKEIERNRMRVRTAAGLFGGIGDDSGRGDDGGGEEE